jgi:hypothetical protein
VFALFLNDEAVWLTALDMDGSRLWQTEIGPFDSQFGFGSSPTIYKSLVLAAADHDAGGGYLAAVHRETGKIRWRRSRPAFDSFCSPVVFHLAGKDQLLMSGCEMVASYDPNTGDELWSCEGTTELTVGTPVVCGDLVFASGGYPGSETLCVRADGSGEVVWRNRTKIYTGSMLVHEGLLYAVADNGVAYCFRAETGEQLWEEKIGRDYSASPVLAGGLIYVASERGSVVVLRPSAEKCDVVATNQLGDEIWATPTICGGRIFLRVASQESDRRQEYLYCIGQPDAGA